MAKILAHASDIGRSQAAKPVGGAARSAPAAGPGICTTDAVRDLNTRSLPTDAMSLQMKLFAITLDFPDPPALAALCQQATGLEKHPKSDADFAGVNGEHGLFIGLQRVDGYQAPGRPDQIVPQQLHICFKVDEDLDEAEARLLELGAGKPDHQPHGTSRGSSPIRLGIPSVSARADRRPTWDALAGAVPLEGEIRDVPAGAGVSRDALDEPRSGFPLTRARSWWRQ
jgi:hypothetical protein